MTFYSLGIDPGTTHVAAARLKRDSSGWSLVDSPVLNSLDDLLDYLVATSRDELHCVCVEDISWLGAAKGGGHGHGSTEIVRAVGAAQLFARQLRVPFVEVRPQTWRKRVSGSGRATKEQVREWVRRVVRGVPERFGLDRSDAVAIALSAGMQGRLR